MANSVVFIFLLDHLPGNIPLQPLDNLPVPYSRHSVSSIKHCDHIMNTEPILDMISKAMKIKVVPKWKNHEKFTHARKDIETAENNDSDAILENAAELGNTSLEETQHFIEENELETEFLDDKSECETENTTPNMIDEHKNVTNATKVIFPKTAPFMVAIFESLSNVTAQTCGGALVAPHWVLTVASCVNVLGKLFTNITETSHYTVIANASNPFLDGTVHNVTEILLHPQPQATADVLGLMKHLHKTPMIKDLANKNKDAKRSAVVNRSADVKRSAGVKRSADLKRSADVKTPVLALMRVEPAIEDEYVEIIENKLEPNVDVMVYGWQLVKNDTGHDAMHMMSFPARTVMSSHCEHDVTDDSVCLSNIGANNIQISLGGVVVAQSNNQVFMLGIAQSNDHTSFTALPLSSHAVWINRVLAG